MKYFLITLFLFTTAIFWNKSQSDNNKQIREKISDDLYFCEIEDSIYLINHCFPGEGNSLVVILPGGKAVLLDTPFEPNATKSLIDWIHQKFGKPEIITIVTGYHQDNLGGNEYLISQKIPVYGSDLTAKLVREKEKEFKELIIKSVEKEENRKYYEAYSILNLTPPNKLFPLKEGLILNFGDEVIETYFPGESHDIDNIVIYLHKRKVLFGGCMLKGMNFNNPGFIAFANMEEWPLAIGRVIEKFPDCNIVVPGHGVVGGKETLSHMLEILNNWKLKNNK